MPEIEKKYILLRKDGYGVKEAGEKLGKNKNWACIEEKKVKKLGLLTEKEITEGKDRRKRKEMEEDPIVQKIIRLKKEGQSDNAIAKLSDIKFSQPKVSKIVREAERLGLLNKAKVEEARQSKDPKVRKIVENEKMVEDIDKEQLLEFLKLGYDLFKIKRKMCLPTVQIIKKAINKLIKEKRITEEKIQVYKEEREKRDKEEILEKLKDGIPTEIIAKDLDYDVKRMKKLIQEVKEEENITDEEIAIWKENRETITKRRMNVVLMGLKDGLKPREMCAKYSEYGLNGSNIEYCIQKLIDRRDSALDEIKQNNEKMQKRIRNRADRLRKIRKKVVQEHEQLKREMEMKIKLDKKLSQEDQEKIRELINLYYKRYQKYKIENITKLELLNLKQALQRIPINEKDIIMFCKLCMMIQEYEEAIQIIRSRNNNPMVTIKENQKDKIESLETTLNKVIKLKKAIKIIKSGNTNTTVLAEVTGLSKDEINILKIKVQKKSIRFFNVEQREKILNLLMKDIDTSKIQRRFELTDFEMQDIQEQLIEYKKCKVIGNKEQEIREESKARIVVLYTKLGKSPQYIASVMRQEVNEVQEIIEYALEKELIYNEELAGINPLSCYQKLKEDRLLKIEQ